jgi:hypothetical protein
MQEKLAPLRALRLRASRFALRHACVIAVALTSVGALLFACKHHDEVFAHRPEALSCAAHPLATMSACTSANDCGADAGLACAKGACALDSCTTDDDCGAGRVCACFGAVSADEPSIRGNVCSAPGNCRVDADCPTEQVCSPSYTMTCASPFAVTYACHTPNDDCSNDTDCTSPEHFAPENLCTWQPERGRWGCVAFGCGG